MYDEGDFKEHFDDLFVKQFLLNGSIIAPTETILVASNDLKDLTSTIKANKTYCFKTEAGQYGWCATCRVRNFDLA